MYVGIDPDTKGAIAVLDKGGARVSVLDMPSSKVEKSHYIRGEEFIKALEGSLYACIECVGSRGGNSAQSMFSFGSGFGFGFGSALTLLYMSELSPTMPLPQEWQKHFGLTKKILGEKLDKKHIANKCLELYPDANLYGPRGGLKDGRSDAIMIARFLFDKITLASNKEELPK